MYHDAVVVHDISGRMTSSFPQLPKSFKLLDFVDDSAVAALLLLQLLDLVPDLKAGLKKATYRLFGLGHDNNGESFFGAASRAFLVGVRNRQSERSACFRLETDENLLGLPKTHVVLAIFQLVGRLFRWVVRPLRK